MSGFMNFRVCAIKRAFRYTVATLIIAVTMTACGNGGGEANPPVSVEQYEWVAMEQLLLPTPLPENGKYALQAGQFAYVEAADELHRRAMALGLLSSTIPVVDKNGQHWFIVSVGSFESPDAARASRASISSQLGISEQLPLILLPPMYAPLALQVTASKGSLDSSGLDGSEITIFVQAKDANKNVVNNVPVNFSASSGKLTVGSRITDAQGMVSEKLSTGGDPTNRLIVVTVHVAGTPDSQIVVPVSGTKILISSDNTVTVGGSGGSGDVVYLFSKC